MQRQVAFRRARAIDLDLIQVEEDRGGAGDLQPDETPADLAFLELHLQRRRAADAPEMLALVLVPQRPLLAVLRSQDAEVVGIVQAGGVVQTVKHDHAAKRDHLAQVHLPPGIGLLARCGRHTCHP